MSTINPIKNSFSLIYHNNHNSHQFYNIVNSEINLNQINKIKQPSLVSQNYTAEDFKGHNGRTIVELVLRYGVVDTKLRGELRSLIHEIIKDDTLLNFFMTVTPPEDTGYVFWDCPEMTKMKSIFTSDDETLFTLGFKCRALQLFFSNTSSFYEKFSQA